jgi:hypothetical protein
MRPSGANQSGRRPVYGTTEKFQTDPHCKGYILFFEYFHGELNRVALISMKKMSDSGDRPCAR